MDIGSRRAAAATTATICTRLSFLAPSRFCDGELTNCIGPAVNEVDNDLDGRLQCDGDCNDDDATIFGRAQFFVDGEIAASALNCRAVQLTVDNSQPELCDLLDNDCDNLTNEVFRTLFHFRDTDFDGFADVNADDRDIAEFPDCQVFNGCEVTFPRGWAPNRTDCDDGDAAVHPDGSPGCRVNDTCELTGVPVDNNCNGRFDEADIVDLDNDGFANVSASTGTDVTCPLRADAFTCFASSFDVIVNGGFENMDLSGWESVDQIGGSGRWDVYSGTSTFINGFTVPAPMSGGFAGVTDQSGPGSHVLQQIFSIPSNAQSVVLSFDMFLLNQDSEFITNSLDLGLRLRFTVVNRFIRFGSFTPPTPCPSEPKPEKMSVSRSFRNISGFRVILNAADRENRGEHQNDLVARDRAPDDAPAAQAQLSASAIARQQFVDNDELDKLGVLDQVVQALRDAQAPDVVSDDDDDDEADDVANAGVARRSGWFHFFKATNDEHVLECIAPVEVGNKLTKKIFLSEVAQACSNDTCKKCTPMQPTNIVHWSRPALTLQPLLWPPWRSKTQRRRSARAHFSKARPRRKTA
jgi:hypothetical protein